MKKFGSILIIAVASLFFACNGSSSKKMSDSTSMTAPDTSMNHNMNNMPADTSKKDTAMKK